MKIVKKSLIGHQLVACLLLLLFVTPSYAIITLDITPGNNQQAVFQLSGQFDGNINTELFDLVAFAFAPRDVWANNSSPFIPFDSSLATIVNVTSGNSAEITYFDVGDYLLFYFALNTSLPTHPGNTLELISHGPVTASTASFTDFIPGTYVFSNPSFGPTTFEINVIPEPSTITMLGIGTVGLVMLRRRSGKLSGE
jgi:hypothetical protein